ncbi:MAG: DUF3140 domain-containing protein [Rivularia sp. (in: cyanobacteria)]
MSKDKETVIKEFDDAVNMTAKQLESWLETEDSKSVGQKNDGDDESKGHKSGKHIIDILQKKKDDYTDDDVSHMRKVVSYVHRHSAQKPDGDIEDTPWRFSLMNWGHDPMK